MNGQRSITRGLILGVLLIEAIAALTLITAIAFHEYRIQLSAFDATLRGGAELLLGAVQDAEDTGDNVMLETNALHLMRNAIYSVQDDPGRILGSSGTLPSLDLSPHRSEFAEARVAKKRYRFVVLHGIRTIDPGRADGGSTHRITVVYGVPVERVRHEVFEAIRFFALATAILLTVTAFVMIVVIRRVLQPLHDLTAAAGHVSAANWIFATPGSATYTRELKPLADALSAALARLQLSFTQQKRFTNDAAHELKTDVAIVKSSLQLLSMKTRTSEEYRAGLAKTLVDIERFEKTVQTMLTLARLEQPTAGAPSLCYFGQAVEEGISLCTPYAEMRSVELRSSLSADPRIALETRDAVLLCSNLLMNAIQHSREEQTVEISLTAQNGTVELSIVDGGEGIRDEDKPFVFDAFYRGDPSRSRKSGGTGLGLAICKAICVRANGSIGISSEDGRGTKVMVQFPFRDATEEA